MAIQLVCRAAALQLKITFIHCKVATIVSGESRVTWSSFHISSAVTVRAASVGSVSCLLAAVGAVPSRPSVCVRVPVKWRSSDERVTAICYVTVGARPRLSHSAFVFTSPEPAPLSSVASFFSTDE